MVADEDAAGEPTTAEPQTEATPPVSPGTAGTRRDVDGRSFLRLPVRTRWLAPGDDLVTVAQEYLPALNPHDTIVVSEKIVILLAEKTVPMADIHPGRLARFLARRVRPRQGSRGLSIPEKMQYVLQTVGRPRVLAAAAAGVVTRPFGVHGMFYRVAGSIARDIDGGRPPYEDLLFPPLPAALATDICAELQDKLDVGVAIVDINDFGGSVRATSSRALPAEILRRVLADNPLGQRSTSTPIAVVRPVTDRPAS